MKRSEVSPEMQRVLVKNALKLVRHHKANCEGETCTIQVYFIRMLIQLAELDDLLTEDEKREMF